MKNHLTVKDFLEYIQRYNIPEDTKIVVLGGIYDYYIAGMGMQDVITYPDGQVAVDYLTDDEIEPDGKSEKVLVIR